MTKKNKFDVGDLVEHRASGEKGVVMIANLLIPRHALELPEYLLAIDFGKTEWAAEDELKFCKEKE